ncbi:hypothetical protein Fcan01_11093 [Folsomia candida]|uniref:Uncharacterized protein n=2 Tax=Folsomia candida TaxID=158441 RepID=A0A226E993_FOLCA|nr:hypothetical protein Fcan01_11093 [Folsomia candida]
MNFIQILPFLSTFFGLFSSSFSNLLQVPPIIWYESGVKLITNFTHETVSIQVPSPCDKLKYGLPSRYNRCSEEFEKHVLKPLEDLCSPNFANLHHVSKRSPQYPQQQQYYPNNNSPIQQNQQNFQIPNPNSNPNQDYPPPTQPNPQINQNQYRINQLDNEMQGIKNNLRATSDLAQNTKGRVDQLETNFQIIARKNQNLSLEFEELQRNYQDVRDTSQANYFERMTNEIESYKAGDRIFSLFGQKINFTKAQVAACHFNRREATLIFDVSRTIVADDIKILRASAFTFYHKFSGKDEKLGVKLEYVGPKYVAYNTTSNCVTPHGHNPSTDLVLLPELGEACATHDFNHPDTLAKYWRKSCEPMYYLDQGTIQVKKFGDNYYTYCAGHEVNAYKKWINCPPHVFSIHGNETVSLTIRVRPSGGDEQIIRLQNPFLTTAVVKNHANFSEELSTKVTHILMPQLGSISFDMFPLSGSCPNSNDMEKAEKSRIEMAPASFVTGGRDDGSSSKVSLYVGVLALCLTLVNCGIIIYFRLEEKKYRLRAGRNNGWGTEEPSRQPMIMDIIK